MVLQWVCFYVHWSGSMHQSSVKLSCFCHFFLFGACFPLCFFVFPPPCGVLSSSTMSFELERLLFLMDFSQLVLVYIYKLSTGVLIPREPMDSHFVTGADIEEPCEANELEKRRAASAINNILSVLTHYSELTGRLICGKRCCCYGTTLLGSSITISLGRIKQSFVL